MQDKLAGALSRAAVSVKRTIENLFTVEGGGRIASTSLARGATWAITTLGVFILLAGILESVIYGKADLGEVAKLGSLLGIASSGAPVNVINASLGLGAEIPVFAEVGLRVTLATLILVIIAYVRGRRVIGIGTSNSTKVIAINAVTTGFGFVAVLELVSLAVQGSLTVGTTTLTVVALSPLSLIIPFFVIAVPSFVGGLVGRRKALNSTSPTLTTWATRAILTFAVSYFAVLIVVALIYGIISWIQPEFANSVPDAQAPALDAKLVIGTILGVLAFLPTLIFTAFGVGIGGSLGLSAQLGEGNSAIWGAVNGQFGKMPFANFSIFGTVGWAWELIVLGLVAAVAITSAVIAARRTGYTPRNLLDFIRVTAIALGIAFVAQGLTQVTLAWSNHGQGAETFDQGAVFRDAGAAQYGITAISLAIIAALVAVAATGAAKVLVPVITDAFPRLIAVGSGVKRTAGEPRSLAGRIIGAVTVVVIILAIAIPTAIASVERVWGAIDSPMTVGAGLADKLQNASVADAKALLGHAEAKNWLSDEILTAAKPTNQWSRSVDAVNDQKQAWQVGNLDAVIGITWINEKHKAAWTLPTSSKLDNVWGVLRHATYTSTPTNLEFALSVGSKYPADQAKLITVNGQSLKAGTYLAFPGLYHVQAPGYRLIGAVDEWVGSSGDVIKVSVGTKIVLPDTAESEVKKVYDTKVAKCASIDADGNSACYTSATVFKTAELTSGTEPADYFGSKTSNFKSSAATCTKKGDDQLVSASQMVRTFDCTSDVTFNVAFTSRVTKEVTRPVYGYSYPPCEYVGWDLVCPDPVQVQTGTETVTEEVEGPVIATTSYTSKVAYTIKVNGTLDANNVFRAS